ncbi:MAG: glycosyltransferase family 1 protein [Planctomycetota bacterium]|nr:MAG: glycosyltransferase family 1 protein [Planctomycetota bacterium]
MVEAQTTSRPRRVLFVMNAAGGGAAMSTIALAEALTRKGIGACAVCYPAGTEVERQSLCEAMQGAVEFAPLYWWNRKLRVPRWRRPLSELKQIVTTGWSHASAARVARKAVEWGVDLIHTNTILTPEGGLAARRLGLPHVWHLRELVGPGQPYRLPYEGPSFGRYMRDYASKVVANSQASAAQVRSWIDDDLLEIVPNGIDLSCYRPRTGSARQQGLVVGMIGNLTSRVKKHPLFIDAAARVPRELDVTWRIYGRDPSRGGTVSGDAYVDGLHAQVQRLGLTGRVEWPGFVADPAEIMSQLDVLVHPADGESFGRIVVEAMAAGLPVVGARGGGVAEIIVDGRTGLLARPDDPQDLAAQIERLLRDPQLRDELGRSGRQRAQEEYSLDACVSRMLNVYAQALRRPLGQAEAFKRAAPVAARASE